MVDIISIPIATEQVRLHDQGSRLASRRYVSRGKIIRVPHLDARIFCVQHSSSVMKWLSVQKDDDFQAAHWEAGSVQSFRWPRRRSHRRISWKIGVAVEVIKCSPLLVTPELKSFRYMR